MRPKVLDTARAAFTVFLIVFCACFLIWFCTRVRLMGLWCREEAVWYGRELERYLTAYERSGLCSAVIIWG